ncbi:isocitrate lyase/phosphoenolpyruvate mutase family protein [Staphylococcus epidermidis]|jgi:phosphoenolpyruvate phosphomutase|uniref:isocitrate lyase/phosphoenolpyruvate mutase family protein n=1 Tax=Staphylococcus epidermidis TaxID=1282 RepID=UPI001889114D|nr:isocitrate lyase/phosphoenolpyruvate mutase family protein [Staphylococcus epidermidis]MBF2304035.1 isocitrate lyase/phosphoenolpyruvate mutase family protein [Staphylococcus epidermidis]MBF2330578.1 isocitrate lyase/phosphoenolpyruvate mutase family protein [Staphylococcus epidermidis]
MDNLLHLLEDNQNVAKIIGVHDVLSALIAEKQGFDAVWVSGLGVSTVRGVPDASILTVDDFLNVAANISDNIKLPIIVDCDSGFGNQNNIEYLVKSYEKRGISGICLEDKPFPKKNSFLEQDSIEDKYTFATKIQMASKTKKSSSFVVIARIESLIVNLGIEDALVRAKIYVDSGADAILIHSKSEYDYSNIVEFADEFRKFDSTTPIIIVPTTYPNISIETCKNKKINGIIYANQLLRAYLTTINQIANTIKKESSTLSIEKSISSISDVFNITDTNHIKENELWASKYYNYLKNKY